MTTDTTTEKPYSIARCDCSGCQACIEMCPELFVWDDINEEVVLAQETADAEQLRQAMAYCPNDCIEVEDDA